MFRHKGKSRTYIHNLRLASILSFIAGIVNITGVLAIKTLTTNVTGHFAYFAEELVSKHYSIAFVFLTFIFSFLLGAFTSNLLIEIVSRRKPSISHVVPMVIEIAIFRRNRQKEWYFIDVLFEWTKRMVFIFIAYTNFKITIHLCIIK